MYVFNGKDCTSAFKGKGEVGLLTTLEKNLRFHKTFMRVGEECNLKYHVLKQLEEFTCLAPSHSALKPHLQRVNHRVALYKRADERIHLGKTETLR